MNKVCGDCARFVLTCAECNSGWCDAMGLKVDAVDKACADYYNKPSLSDDEKKRAE